MLCEHFQFHVGKENRVIRGEVRVSDKSERKPVIIICHGFKGYKDWGFFPTLAQHLANQGFAAITFNFSMNGIADKPDVFEELDKFGRLTFSREQEDLSLLLEQIQQKNLPLAQHFDTKRIGLFGHSRGGGNSLIFALDHPEIGAVVIWNSIHRVDFFAPEVMNEIRQKGVAMITHARTGQQLPITREVLDDIEANQSRFDILTRLPHLTCPLLIVQGDQDLPGLYEGAKKMAQAAPNAQLHIITAANHTMGAVHPFAGITPQLKEAMEVTSTFYQRKFNQMQA